MEPPIHVDMPGVPYVPLPRRGRLEWPGGKRVAVVITLNLETWDLQKPHARPYYAGGPAVLPDPLPGNVADLPNHGWREYGQRVGLWRLLNTLDAHGVAASCTANAVTFERRRAMTDAIAERGWELLAHNHEQGELLTDYAHDEAAEREVIHRTLDAFERHTGRRAEGWLSSSLRSNPATPSILAAAGIDFWCDLMNDDQPYLVDTAAGSLVAIPYSNEINDFTLLTRRGHTTAEFLDILVAEFDQLVAEGAHQARIMNIGLHPHVSGRAYRQQALDAFLRHAKASEHVWWPTRAEIARWYRTHAAHHIPREAC